MTVAELIETLRALSPEEQALPIMTRDYSGRSRDVGGVTVHKAPSADSFSRAHVVIEFAAEGGPSFQEPELR